MGQAVISSNTSLKVNRAISAATTVNANCYAVITYQKTGVLLGSSGGGLEYGSLNNDVVTRYFGPSQSIPATFTTTNARTDAPTFFVQGTYTIMSGVEFINSP